MGRSVLRAALAAWVAAALAAAQENVLLLIADDVGIDRVAAYEAHPDPGRTPVIDGLAAEGVLFENAWSAPACSPTRAAILTGRYGFRTGIGSVIKKNPGFGRPPSISLPASEVTLPQVLAGSSRASWTAVALGKWHLAKASEALDHPFQSGFAHHLGTPFNLGAVAGADYFRWQKSVDGLVRARNVYATTDTADDAIRGMRSLPEPWFLWVAFQSAHKPYHAPPEHLTTYELSGDPNAFAPLYHRAMVEAMDTEIGRILASMDPALRARTTIIFAGDNGTPASAIDPPWDTSQGKGSLFQAGIGVPLIIAGPRVAQPGARCRALVHVLDLFATVSEIVGVDPASALPPGTPLDSISLLPYLSDPGRPSLRRTVYSELFAPNGPGPHTLKNKRAIRDSRYKLIENAKNDTQSLYDLERDPREQHDLMLSPLSPQAAAARAHLLAAMRQLLES